MGIAIRRIPTGLACVAAALLPGLAASLPALADAVNIQQAVIRELRPLSAAGTSNYSIDEIRQQVGTDLLLVGPVTRVEAASHSLEVLGQSVTLKSSALDDALVATRLGQVLAIAGNLSPEGHVTANRIFIVPTEYVDGATEVMVSGSIGSLDASIARAKIGEVTVDYSPALHAGDLGISAGSVVQFSGISSGGTRTMIAFNARSVSSYTGSSTHESVDVLAHANSSQLAGSMGSGVDGSMGSGRSAVLRGSMGSGAAGSMGSGIDGSMGSGSAGSMGSGLDGSMGSGLAGSMGSGHKAVVRGSMGSGSAGSMGSGLAGSMGSGHKAVVGGSMGSGAAGSMGSGLAGSMGSGHKAVVRGSMGSGL